MADTSKVINTVARFSFCIFLLVLSVNDPKVSEIETQPELIYLRLARLGFCELGQILKNHIIFILIAELHFGFLLLK